MVSCYVLKLWLSQELGYVPAMPHIVHHALVTKQLQTRRHPENAHVHAMHTACMDVTLVLKQHRCHIPSIEQQDWCNSVGSMRLPYQLLSNIYTTVDLKGQKA